MTEISKPTPKDIHALLGMIARLCAQNGDTSQLGMAQAQAQLIYGPLVCFIVHKVGKRVG
ncbi:hypothetical protein [Yoonia sediminilitoris]|nr:hypothetical protein [Yoonia sediminilitoris]